jgi:hypothetical protein
MSPSLSVSTHPGMGQRSGSGSLLSSDDAHYRRSPSDDEVEDQEGMFEQMQTSVWGGKQISIITVVRANARYDARSSRPRRKRRSSRQKRRQRG